MSEPGGFMFLWAKLVAARTKAKLPPDVAVDAEADLGQAMVMVGL